jgi:methionyl-tRNA synthetase
MKILVTSALPYVNNIPHLGNLIGSVLSADAFSRYMRLKKNEVLFVLGTDEYGTTAEAKAREEGLTPRELVDKYFKIHKEIYDWFNTSYDCLGRSTSNENKIIVQDIFRKVYANGYFIEGEVEQLYSNKSQMFLSDRFVEGECPICHAKGARGDQCDSCGNLLDQKDLINPISKIDGTIPILKKTKHLYINLPKLEDDLKSWVSLVDSNWSFLAKNITAQWFKQGLKERAITRDLKWGIEVPLEGYENKVFYSWFDAPIAYIGITYECLGEKYKDWWMNPEVSLYQFMGKDNVPFHSIMFPAYLLATKENYNLVKGLDSTAYLNYENDKFSKSKNKGVFGNDAINSGISSDIWRYYLYRVRPENDDTEFLWDDFYAKVNNELVGNFGNFINRVISLNEKFFNGQKQESDGELLLKVKPLVQEYFSLMDKSREKDALLKANEISSVGNKYLQDNMPWTVAKTDLIKAGKIIANCIDLFKILSLVYYPFVPKASEKIARSISFNLLDGFDLWDTKLDKINVLQVGILFEKLDLKQVQTLKEKFSGNN